MKKLIALALAASLVGCASTEEYKLYSSGQAQIETAKYNADAAKYAAMADIARSGTESAKVAAVMALALGAQGSNAQTTRIQAPQPNQALQWAQVLVPSITQVAGMRYNYLSQQTSSNNAARVAESTNATFLGMAGRIQAPAANVTTTTTTTETLSGFGVLGSGTYSTTTTDSNDQTLAGTGTLGSGAYGTTDNNSSNTVPATVVPVEPVTDPVVQ